MNWRSSADWRSPDDYPNVKTTTAREWAAEFSKRLLRRDDISLMEGAWDRGLAPREVAAMSLRSGLEKLKESWAINGDISLIPHFEEHFYNAECWLEEKQPEEVAMVFNLHVPLSPQLKAVESYLKAKQPKLRPLRIQNGALYQRYLRLLDAQDEGASAREIANVLFPHIANEDPAYSASRLVRDELKAALRMMRSGHLDLPFHETKPTK